MSKKTRGEGEGIHVRRGILWRAPNMPTRMTNITCQTSGKIGREVQEGDTKAKKNGEGIRESKEEEE